MSTSVLYSFVIVILIQDDEQKLSLMFKRSMGTEKSLQNYLVNSPKQVEVKTPQFVKVTKDFDCHYRLRWILVSAVKDDKYSTPIFVIFLHPNKLRSLNNVKVAKQVRHSSVIS